MRIDPIFTEFGITYKEKIHSDAVDIPVDHPAYKDIWRRIDNYTDKYFLAKKFEADEDNNSKEQLQKKLKLLKELLEMHEDMQLFTRITSIWSRYENDIVNGKMNQGEAEEEFFTDKIFEINDKLTVDHVKCLNMRPYYRPEDCMKEINITESKLNNVFSQAIRERYPFECNPNNRVKLELETQADLIIKDRNEIRDNFQDMQRNTQTKHFLFDINPVTKDKSKRLEVCKILEKHFGLRHNPKNGIYYISNGEGMYVPFDETNLNITYSALRDKFTSKYKKNKKIVNEDLIFTKGSFYSIADEYCVVESESEQNIISFPNCCYDSKTKVIHQFDHRLPRLPMKSCNINFVFDRDLTGQGGALEEILNYCFDEKSRDIIFQYYGRALFEKGFTETQEVLLVMGKGNVGKTTFFNTLSKIFNKVHTLSSSIFTPDNEFAFGELPGCDFFVMDEITASKKGFVDKVKEFTSGSESILCNKKYKTPINLDCEYIPRCIMIGNALPKHVYSESAGAGVLRRFPIIFLKNSILKAKKLTIKVTINGETKEYPATKNGKNVYLIPSPNEFTDDGEAVGQLYKFEYDQLIPVVNHTGKAIIGKQGRTNFTTKELKNTRSLEWFLQQVILKYKSSEGKFFSNEESSERFLKAYNPERWVIRHCVEAHYTHNGEFDNNESILAKELLKKIHKIVDKNMLERTIFDPNSDALIEIIGKEINSTPSYEDKNGKREYYGLSFDASKLIKHNSSD